jgi:pimeloyl-ACP methyl ester carboxylesterase
VFETFTPSHRCGTGSPLVLLHGFSDTWRIWELALPVLERHHDVLALTLPGHAGGPALQGEVVAALMPDAVERAMDEAGFETAHFAGNSLGAFVALQLAARGRARSVVAFAPAGGWAKGDEVYQELLASQARMCEQAKATAAHAPAIVSTAEGRRQATRLTTMSFEHIPAELLAHQMLGTAGCAGAPELIEYALREGFELDAEQIACPVRVVWGTDDVIVPWPSSAVRYRHEWLPQADWVELEGVGHCPPLDVPLETAQLILGFTSD